MFASIILKVYVKEASHVTLFIQIRIAIFITKLASAKKNVVPNGTIYNNISLENHHLYILYRKVNNSTKNMF